MAVAGTAGSAIRMIAPWWIPMAHGAAGTTKVTGVVPCRIGLRSLVRYYAGLQILDLNACMTVSVVACFGASRIGWIHGRSGPGLSPDNAGPRCKNAPDYPGRKTRHMAETVDRCRNRMAIAALQRRCQVMGAGKVRYVGTDITAGRTTGSILELTIDNGCS